MRKRPPQRRFAPCWMPTDVTPTAFWNKLEILENWRLYPGSDCHCASRGRRVCTQAASTQESARACSSVALATSCSVRVAFLFRKAYYVINYIESCKARVLDAKVRGTFGFFLRIRPQIRPLRIFRGSLVLLVTFSDNRVVLCRKGWSVRPG